VGSVSDSPVSLLLQQALADGDRFAITAEVMPPTLAATPAATFEGGGGVERPFMRPMSPMAGRAVMP